MYAGNCLARDFGVVRWTRNTILNSAALCFRAARDLLPTENNRLRDTNRRLTKALNALPELKAIDWANGEEPAGFRERSADKSIYVVKVEEFVRMVGDEQKAAVLQWLTARRRIILKAKKTPAQPKEQFKWPDGKKHRSFKISWPVKKKTKRSESRIMRKRVQENT
jgi:hypothetical protein